MNQDHNDVPVEFDGVFRFTNPTDEEFTTMWNSVEYSFPAHASVPLVIPSESSDNIQEIRKKFAKRLGEKYFFSSARHNELNELTKKTGIPPLVDLEKEPVFIEFVQKCLEPLPIGKMTSKAVPKSHTETTEYTKVIGEKDSLKANTTDATGQLESLPTE